LDQCVLIEGSRWINIGSGRRRSALSTPPNATHMTGPRRRARRRRSEARHLPEAACFATSCDASGPALDATAERPGPKPRLAGGLRGSEHDRQAANLAISSPSKSETTFILGKWRACKRNCPRRRTVAAKIVLELPRSGHFQIHPFLTRTVSAYGSRTGRVSSDGK